MSMRHLIEPQCAVCGVATALVELVPPGLHPRGWEMWEADRREAFAEFHDPTKWRFVYEGPGGGSSSDVDDEYVAKVAAAFAEPLTIARIRGGELHDNAGFCVECGVPYCFTHWKVTESGRGWCPKGHFASLDPHASY